MKLTKLIGRIKDLKFSFRHIANGEEEIYHCRLLEKGLILKPGILYLCKSTQLKKRMDTAGLSFLCLPELPSDGKAVKTAAVYRFHNANVIDCTGSFSLPELEADITDILTRESLLSAHMYQIIRILHSNLGLQSLVDAAYDILNNPLLIVDKSYKILASCQNAVYTRPDLNYQKNLGYMLESNISAMKEAKLYEKARTANYPYYSKEDKAAEGWITALVYIHGIETAHIAVSDTNHPFTGDDFEFIDFLCRIVSLELQKTDFYKTNKSMMHSFFLSELLDNHFQDMETIHRRAQSLDWIRTPYLRIMTLSDVSSSLFDQKAQLVSRHMASLFSVCHWVVYNGYLVFLLGTEEASLELYRSNEALKEFLDSNRLTASFSRCFHSLIDTRRFYEESLTAHQLGQQFQPEASMHFYTDYICQHIGQILARQGTLAHFYHPAIEKMQEYDHIHHTSFISTLKEYLTWPDSPGTAAAHLFVHKNTLFYRMAKIKELFSLDLSNGEERLILHLSLKFMELESHRQ